MSQPLRRYLVCVALCGSDPKQKWLERPRTPVISRWRGARLLDDACGQVGRIEAEAVFQPEAEELADVAELRVLVTDALHADDRIWFAQPDQRTAHHLRPGCIATEWRTDFRRSGGEIGPYDCERGGDIGAAVGGGDVKRVVLEFSQFRALVERFEIANQPAPDHVALKRDVVTGREH